MASCQWRLWPRSRPPWRNDGRQVSDPFSVVGISSLTSGSSAKADRRTVIELSQQSGNYRPLAPHIPRQPAYRSSWRQTPDHELAFNMLSLTSLAASPNPVYELKAVLCLEGLVAGSEGCRVGHLGWRIWYLPPTVDSSIMACSQFNGHVLTTKRWS